MVKLQISPKSIDKKWKELINDYWIYRVFYDEKEEIIYNSIKIDEKRKNGIIIDGEHDIENTVIFDAWYPIIRKGKFISVYDAKHIPKVELVDMPSPDLTDRNIIFELKGNSQDDFDRNGKNYYPFYFRMMKEGPWHYKRFGEKGFKIPIDELTEEKERKYIDDLKKYCYYKKSGEDYNISEMLARKIDEVIL